VVYITNVLRSLIMDDGTKATRHNDQNKVNCISSSISVIYLGNPAVKKLPLTSVINNGRNHVEIASLSDLPLVYKSIFTL
jgi:hypothetical protein